MAGCAERGSSPSRRRLLRMGYSRRCDRHIAPRFCCPLSMTVFGGMCCGRQSPARAGVALQPGQAAKAIFGGLGLLKFVADAGLIDLDRLQAVPRSIACQASRFVTFQIFVRCFVAQSRPLRLARGCDMVFPGPLGVSDREAGHHEPLRRASQDCGQNRLPCQQGANPSLRTTHSLHGWRCSARSDGRALRRDEIATALPLTRWGDRPDNVQRARRKRAPRAWRRRFDRYWKRKLP